MTRPGPTSTARSEGIIITVCARDDDDAGLGIVKQKPFCKVDSIPCLSARPASPTWPHIVRHRQPPTTAASASPPYYGSDRPSTSTGPFSSPLLLHCRLTIMLHTATTSLFPRENIVCKTGQYHLVSFANERVFFTVCDRQIEPEGRA